MDRAAVIVSNRGPLSFRRADDGTLSARRGAGGLVSGLGPLVAGTDTLWVAAAMSEGDRAAADAGVVDAEDFRVRLLAVDAETYRLAYDVISNQVLWFLHHGLYDLPREPAFGPGLADAWQAYREVNRAFADAVADAAPDGRRRARAGLPPRAHGPDAGREPPRPRGRPLPPHAVRHAHLAAGASAARGRRGRVGPRRPPRLRVPHRPLGRRLRVVVPGRAGPHAPHLRLAAARPPPTTSATTAASPACAAALAEIDETVGDRLVVARVDRIELSKNLLRGFQAFDLLLERHPEWRERVVFLASVYPSRTGVPAYIEYQQDVEALVEEINERWATPGWTPIVYDTRDDYPRSVAVLRRADVLLVNPIRDGLNLVAKEGAIVNERDAVLCLSPEAGVWDEVGEAAVEVAPFDVAGTAEALDRALRMPADERAARAARLRQLSTARGPADWLADQLAAAD